jgi:hypothetical protein
MLESGLHIDELLKCVKYFQMKHLEDWIKENLEELPDWDLTDPKVFKKAIRIFESCADFNSFKHLCAYVQEEGIKDDYARFKELPLAYLVYMLQFGHFSGTNHQMFEYYGRIYGKLSKEDQQVLKPLLYVHLPLQNVQVSRLFNISFAETQLYSSILHEKLAMNAWNLPNAVMLVFVHDDVTQTLEFPFSYAMVDYRFQVIKNINVGCYLAFKPHLLPEHRLPEWEFILQECDTLKLVSTKKISTYVLNYANFVRKRKLKKEEFSRGWTLKALFTKNKKYLLTLKFLGYFEYNYEKE